jgi:aconitate hydratase
LDLGSVQPSLAGPKRPQDRVPLRDAKSRFLTDVQAIKDERSIAGAGPVSTSVNGEAVEIADGAVVIAAITSCTNTSNPSVMLAAGLVARNAVAKGLQAQPWVKTSLAPGSLAVTRYLQAAGLMESLEALGFHVVGYGCTTCIGNSGPLLEEVSAAIRDGNLVAASVLSGNRNFEGRVHPEVRMNYLASPPLVVAYAIAGRMDLDLYNDPLGQDGDGNPVYLKDLWPSQQEIHDVVQASVTREKYSESYADLFAGEANWRNIDVDDGQLYAWQDDSTYVKNPPYFDGMTMQPDAIGDIVGARVLASLGDSVTTDHISPAGSIKADSPAGEYLQAKGVAVGDFNSYGARRGNHEVMMRGTFANIRLRNKLAPGTEGGFGVHLPDGEQMTIFDAAMKYQAEGVPTIVLAGKEYGSGSSRDWAAKGPLLLGVRAVIVESYEKIHRSNLIGMGILPLQYRDGENAESLGLTGREVYSINGLGDGTVSEVTVTAQADDGTKVEFQAHVRIETPQEVEYYAHGGILHYVLRNLAA